MAADQSMTQAIMQVAIEATKAVVMAVIEVDNPVNNARPIHVMPRSGILALRQPTLAWNVADKFQELCNFEIDVMQ